MADEGTQTPSLEERRKLRHESRTSSTYKSFLKTLADLGGFDEEFAECAAVSVLCALEQRVIGTEAEDLEAQLPLKLRELLQRCILHEGKPPEKYGKDELFQRVAEELEIDTDRVESVVLAVVQAVRMQISEGEAEDFANMLPADLRELWNRPS